MNLGVGNPFKVCYDIIFDITYVVLPQKVKFEVMKSWSFDVMFGEEFLLTYQTHCREKKLVLTPLEYRACFLKETFVNYS